MVVIHIDKTNTIVTKKIQNGAQNRVFYRPDIIFEILVCKIYLKFSDYYESWQFSFFHQYLRYYQISGL